MSEDSGEEVTVQAEASELLALTEQVEGLVIALKRNVLGAAPDDAEVEPQTPTSLLEKLRFSRQGLSAAKTNLEMIAARLGAVGDKPDLKGSGS